MSIYFQKNYDRSFGTYPLRGQALKDAMQCATDVGYRAFDTAQMYCNESDVGDAMRALGVPRNELCVTTKVHPDHYSETSFLASVKDSLRKLQTDYVDVLLLHWPPTPAAFTPTLQLLEEAAKTGLTRFIGVSNFPSSLLRDAVAAIPTPLVTNQVEFHPLLDQSILLQASRETGVPLSSYCSVARGAVFKHSVIQDIATAYGKTPAQVVLRWILQMGVNINTMSTQPQNVHDNYNVMDFTLSTPDMARIGKLTAIGHRIVGKAQVPWAPEWDVPHPPIA